MVNGESEQLLLDALSATSSLSSIRSLRLRWQGRNQPSLSSHISIPFTHLVSLELGNLSWPLEPLVLPKLEILIAEIWQVPAVDFTCWSLPVLRMLGVRPGHHGQGFNYGIFRPIATKVEALSIINIESNYTRARSLKQINMNLFENFPTLRILFIRDAPFIVKGLIPIDHPLAEVHISNSYATDSVSLLELTSLDHGILDHTARFIADSVTWKDIRTKFSYDYELQWLVHRHQCLNLALVEKLGRSFEEFTREGDTQFLISVDKRSSGEDNVNSPTLGLRLGDVCRSYLAKIYS